MPDLTNYTEGVRAGTPLTVDSVILLPIERVVLYSDRIGRHAWFSASKEPYALIVRDAGGIRVLATGPVAVSLEALCEKVPGLDAVLGAIQGRFT